MRFVAADSAGERLNQNQPGSADGRIPFAENNPCRLQLLQLVLSEAKPYKVNRLDRTESLEPERYVFSVRYQHDR